MRSHPIALINPPAQDNGMELLIASLILIILGLLATTAGVDSRDADTRFQPRAW
jgi:Tfp pilus assembly protein PilX